MNTKMKDEIASATMLAAAVVLGAIGAGAETLTITKDTTLMTNAVYDSVSVASNATLNLNGRKLATGAISGGGTVMSAMIDDSPCAYGYTVLDYVQSPADNTTSKVLIDTLYKPICTDRVETKVEFASVSGTQGIFSSRKTSATQTFTCLLTSSKIRFDRNTKTSHATSGTVSQDTPYEIIADFGAFRYMINGGAPLATTSGTGTFTAYTNILLFATGEATAPASSCKMYYFRVFDKDGNMKVNMVPASKGGIAGFYDTVRKLFLVPASGALTAGDDISYKMLSYVQTPADNNNTEKASLDTEYTPLLTDRIETKIRPSSTALQGVFSARETSSTNTFTCLIGKSSNSEFILRCDHHKVIGSSYVYHQTSGTVTKFAPNEDYEIVADGDTLEFSVNGVESSKLLTAGPEDKSANPGMTLRLFAVATKGGSEGSYANGCRMYSFRVTDTNGYVRLNLVPAQLSDGSKIGFYDTVRNMFFGSSLFIAGDTLPADLTEAGGTFRASCAPDYGSLVSLFNNNLVYSTLGDSRFTIRPSSKLPLRIDYDFGDSNAKVVNMYRIWGGMKDGNGNRSPSEWEFYGSDSAYESSDETGWTRLDVAARGENLPGVSNNTRADCCTRIFDNTDAYRYYRLKVTAGGNSNNYLDITQLEYFNVAAAANPGELCFDVAAGEAATNATVALGGNLKVVKEGEGSLLLSCVSNLFYTGGTDVEAGEFVVGASLSTTLTIADGATLGFNFVSRDAVPLLTLESGSSIPSSLGVSIYRAGRFSLPKAGATLTSGYDFGATTATLLNPAAGAVRLRKDDSGNLVAFGPSGLMIFVE